MNTDEANRLASDNWRLAHYAAKMVCDKLGSQNDFEELLSMASLCLVRAARRYDPERGLKFSTYFCSRIVWMLLGYYNRAKERRSIPVVEGLNQDYIPRHFDGFEAVERNELYEKVVSRIRDTCDEAEEVISLMRGESRIKSKTANYSRIQQKTKRFAKTIREDMGADQCL
jgi:DNA-directed RNA polymerase sigma subunit (sigma70/sigma32)